MTDHPRICIVGAGAIGGFVAGRLAQADNDVSLLARGRTLEALREHGQRLDSAGKLVASPVRASDDAQALARKTSSSSPSRRPPCRTSHGPSAPWSAPTRS